MVSKRVDLFLLAFKMQCQYDKGGLYDICTEGGLYDICSDDPAPISYYIYVYILTCQF